MKIIKLKNKNTRNQKTKNQNIKSIYIIITIIITIIGFSIGCRVSANGGGTKGIIATILGHDEHTVDKLEELKVLIIGESDRMTDTLILVSYNPKEQKSKMISIPRDTFVGINKYRATASDKINSIYSAYGIEELIRQVEKLTQENISYYIKVDTQGLRELVDMLGGIDYYVPINMNYDDNRQNLHIHLKKGYQHLDGNKAEQLLRFRHNNNGTTYSTEYGDNDYGRMKTGREFLKEVLNKTIDIGNILKIKEFLELGSKYVETNIKIKDIQDYIPYILEFNTNNLQMEVIDGDSEKCNGVWLFIKK